jgi:CRP-like cAMP-binding protein
MTAPTQKYFRNRLLNAMSTEDFQLLQPHLELVSLDTSQILVEANEPVPYVYFLEYGIGSAVAISLAGERIEVGNIGREGMTGTCLVHGVNRSPIQIFVQVPGPASRMSAGAFKAVLAESPSLHGLLMRYVESTIIQMAHTALANGRHTLSQRLARWLLMSQDRLEKDEIPLTHGFLSLMLGVRRPGVTEALHVLEGEHIIKAVRGSITILDRARLEEAAGDCYGLPELEYERLLGEPVPKIPLNEDDHIESRLS